MKSARRPVRCAPLTRTAQARGGPRVSRQPEQHQDHGDDPETDDDPGLRPPLLLDCAHNPDGAVTLSHSLDPALLDVESRRDIALVFGTVEGKNYRAMLKRLEPVAGHRVYCAPPVPGATDPRKFAELLPGEVAPDVSRATIRL